MNKSTGMSTGRYLQLQHQFDSQIYTIQVRLSTEARMMAHERYFLCFFDSAPVGSVFSACVGHRVVVMLGGLLSSVGMVAGAYAQSVPVLHHCGLSDR